jgi:hypothetical protein
MPASITHHCVIWYSPFFIADAAVSGNKNDLFFSGATLPLDKLSLLSICNQTSPPDCLLEKPEGEMKLSSYKMKDNIAGQLHVKYSETEETIQFSTDWKE